MRLMSQIRSIYDTRKSMYGSPRITLALRASGESVSHKTVEVLMRRAGLRAKGGRRYRGTTDSTQTLSPAPNLLEQKFAVQTLDSVWLSDFTELPCRSGKAYAVAIMDLCSRRILAVSVASTMQTQILLDTLEQACQSRDTGRQKQIIFHSDQGSQYNAEIFRRALTERGFQQSMSRKGNCHDNAPMESFWARMKTELGLPMLFDDVHEARRVILNYVHIFYNRLRTHSGIGNMSPVNFEEQFLLNNRDEAPCQF